jgi:glycosyltransferase involved in cell wall biosynthesis
MASGIPVVATRIAAIPEVVSDQESGFMTQPGDVEEMTERAVELLKHREQRHAMGQRAVQAAKQFDVNKTVDSYLDWYDDILPQQAT